MNVPIKSYLMDTTARPEIIMMCGEGSWLWDSDGRRYLDFVQGWAVNCLGHSHPAIINALTTQARQLISTSPAFYNVPALALAERLATLSGLASVFLCSTGAEANEGAIKLARKFGQIHRNGAWKIITFENGFHGRTLATMSATGKPGWDTRFAPQVSGFPKANYNDLASVEALIDSTTVAVMLEPIQGEAGVIPAERSFLQDLRALCDRHGLLLILDEVQTGVGRTGSVFAFETAGIRPDILSLAKGLGGGVPLAALIANEKANCFAHGDQGGTYTGNPLMAAVGLAVLEIVAAPAFLSEVQARGEALRQGLTALSAKHGLGEVRGAGLLLALSLGARQDAAQIVERARENGLLLNAPRPDSLRFMPALNVSKDEIALMLELLEQALA
ncbi:MAG: acetylornithine transaminase [Betaproteobacteria bacterium]|nr:acetylornithine transaminase [Betaproteobacteria bacterium]